MYVKEKRGWIKHADFMFLDLLCVELVFALAYYIRHGVWFRLRGSIYTELALLLIVFHIIIVFFMEIYRDVLKRGHLREIKSVFVYNATMLLGLTTYMLLRKSTGEYSRFTIIVFLVLNCICMYILHELYKYYLTHRKISEKKKNRLFLICSSTEAEKQVSYILAHQVGMTRLCGIILTDENRVGDMIHDIPVVSDLSGAYEYARTHVVDEILLDINMPDMKKFIEGFRLMGITIHLNIDSLIEVDKGIVEKMNGIHVITTSINAVTTRQLFIKRCIDIGVSLIGCLMTVIFTLIFGPIIFIQSPGPIFFVQERVGKNGRTFHIIKFRSMYMDAEERKAELMANNEMQGLMFKMKDDPRILPIGRFMRRTSIDEFPQFFNILKGDMSLVGTRPPTVDEYEQYELNHKSRLATKPGLTGMWQVSGRSDIQNFEDVVKLDNEYITNWSLGMDIRIIAKTFLVLLKREGSC